MSTTSSLTVEVPDIGDFDDVPVIEILVAAGDTVAAEDPLVTLESDKATMDVPAPAAGTIREIQVRIGDRVRQGSVLLTMEPSGEVPESSADAAPAPASPPDTAPAEAVAPPADAAAPPADAAPPEPVIPPEPAAPPPSTDGGALTTARSASSLATTGPGQSHPAIYASPSARRLARELGITLVSASGSGRKGRITREDVQGLADRGPGSPAAAGPGLGLSLPPWPAVEFEKFGPVERVQRSRIQRISGPNIARNWVMIPHVTQNDEADITELEAWRKRLNEEQGSDGVKVTMVTFLIVACVAALKEFPQFNSSLDGEELVLKRYWNIGFAADTPGGLVVPVIKDADKKGLLEIAAELTALSGKAREGKLSPADMNGGTFTISSLGGIGGTGFTPIINAPEVAILGVSRSALKPVWSQSTSSFAPRLIVPLSLSYDHRVIDGASAARFTAHLANVLSDLRRALL
jgi:pyruvate dehydrogenase E2 component (dihydrolipoamide acetyltransferase)